ncbi:hypothetical protein L484_016377 [Morus notabilis]|uniref:Uncharacterized protein n=1 Tax=Morus notabilis TaxID=981085 RepID=W9RYR7_9ROSA|nr:uncharacterized protein LOC21399425 [Morus notabilis]EXB99401.1 hypothetical protein L484_016377 [Morus notabilis]
MSGTKNSGQVPQKSLQIEQDDKFFSRLLSKESSMAYPSSRVLYYGGRPGSVPFLWESEPGTPKSKSCGYESLVPPLTPPPSYYFNTSHKKKNIQKRSRSSNLLNTLFPKKMPNISLNKKTPYSSSALPNSLWSSENSSMLVSLNNAPTAVGAFCGRSSTTSRFSSSSSSSFDWRGQEEDHEVGSPNSTLCFGCYRL